MIAAGFLAAGARVYISARKADACDQTAAERSALGTCVSLPAEISTLDGVHTLVAAYGEREAQPDGDSGPPRGAAAFEVGQKPYATPARGQSSPLTADTSSSGRNFGRFCTRSLCDAWPHAVEFPSR